MNDLCNCYTPGIGQHYRSTCIAPALPEGEEISIIDERAWEAMKRLMEQGPSPQPGRSVDVQDESRRES